MIGPALRDLLAALGVIPAAILAIIVAAAGGNWEGLARAVAALSAKPEATPEVEGRSI